MTSSHFTVATSGIITFLTVSLVAAQSKNSCPDIQRANATGTYRFPGLTESENGDGLVLSSNSSHEWELTQAVFRDPDDLVTEGGSYLAIPRDRSLPDNGAESAAEGGGMQYTTCAQVVKVESIARNETGDCSALLGTECARDLKKHYLSKAKEWAEGDHSDATDYCAAYLSKAWEESEYPGSCKDSDGLESGSQGSMSVGPPYDDGDEGCPISLWEYYYDIESTNTTDQRGNATDAAPEEIDDYTVYDEAVQSITRWIFVRFDNTTNADEPLVDVQMICASSPDIQQGSRKPGRSSGASYKISWSSCLVVTVTLIVLLDIAI